MWVFTKYGFYSIACASAPSGEIDPATVMVRARVRKHLHNLQERFAGSDDALRLIAELPIKVDGFTDYRFRLIMPMSVWVEALAALAREQTWRNFKNEASRFEKLTKQAKGYVDALHSVWEVMFDLQEQQERRGTPTDR